MSTLLLACGSGASDSKKGLVIDKSALPDKIFPIEIQKGGNFESLHEIRMQAKAMIESRIQRHPEPLSMITYDYFLPEFVYNRKFSKTDEYLGHWIKFGEDFTYQYGYYEATAGTGRYHFRDDDQQMLMLNDNEEYEPKLWQLNTNGVEFVLVGRHEFDVSNGMQIKFLSQTTKPIKPH